MKWTSNQQGIVINSMSVVEIVSKGCPSNPSSFKLCKATCRSGQHLRNFTGNTYPKSLGSGEWIYINIYNTLLHNYIYTIRLHGSFLSWGILEISPRISLVLQPFGSQDVCFEKVCEGMESQEMLGHELGGCKLVKGWDGWSDIEIEKRWWWWWWWWRWWCW